MRFSAIPGHDAIKQRLIESVKNNHVAHAQMFIGKEGSASLAISLAYATYINCENKGDNDSCGECASCRKADKLIHPDFHFVYPVFSIPKRDEESTRSAIKTTWRETIQSNPYIDLSDWSNLIEAGNKQCIISVEEGRSIIKYLALKSFESEYKIVFVWLSELMNQSAANAILKILEEPPSKTLFLLISQDAEKNLVTIQSRTQILKIPQYNEDEITSILKNQKGVEDQRATSVARLADGNLNKAFHLLDEVDDDYQVLFRDWMRLCYTQNFSEINTLSEDYQRSSKNRQKGLIQFSTNLLRDLMIYHSDIESLFRVSEETKTFLEGFSKVVSQNKIGDLVAKFGEALYYIERNASPKMAFFNLSISVSKILRQK